MTKVVTELIIGLRTDCSTVLIAKIEGNSSFGYRIANLFSNLITSLSDDFQRQTIRGTESFRRIDSLLSYADTRRYRLLKRINYMIKFTLVAILGCRDNHAYKE